MRKRKRNTGTHTGRMPNNIRKNRKKDNQSRPIPRGWKKDKRNSKKTDWNRNDIRRTEQTRKNNKHNSRKRHRRNKQTRKQTNKQNNEKEKKKQLRK